MPSLPSGSMKTARSCGSRCRPKMLAIKQLLAHVLTKNTDTNNAIGRGHIRTGARAEGDIGFATSVVEERNVTNSCVAAAGCICK